MAHPFAAGAAHRWLLLARPAHSQAIRPSRSGLSFLSAGRRARYRLAAAAAAAREPRAESSSRTARAHRQHRGRSGRQSPADGYTLFVATDSLVPSPQLRKNAGFTTYKGIRADYQARDVSPGVPAAP
jgi:hypothetical protein